MSGVLARAGWIDSIPRPSWLDWLLLHAWVASFIVAGAVAGHLIAGRRGRRAFALAFAVFAVIAGLVVAGDMALEDFIAPRYEHAIDMMIFFVAYPFAFGVMGSIGTAIATRQRTMIRTAARKFALGGLIGGIVFITSIGLDPKGPFAVPAFFMSLAIPGFVGARALMTVVSASTPPTSD
jgi:hypothetical protein